MDYRTVTGEQLDACTRVIDEARREVFYIVASATDPDVTYQVRYNKQYKVLSCTCLAMNPPTDEQGYFKYAPRPCWHVRAVVEHNRQFKAAKKAEAQARARQLRLEELGLTRDEAREALSHTLTVDGQPAGDETLARVFGPHTCRPSAGEIEAMAEAYQSQPFSILR